MNACGFGFSHRRKGLRRALCVLLGITLLVGRPSISLAEVAAQIAYDFVAPPPDLSTDFAPRENVGLRFLTLTTIDGTKLAGALWQPTGKRPEDTTIVVMIHGSGSSYRKLPQSALGGRLATAGYAALAIDTRQHDAAINTENFFDVRKDIEAAVMTAKALGYKRIVVQGHSLGNIQVQFYAATNWESDIKAVILLGAFGNLPWKTRTMLVQDEDKFKQLSGEALDALRAGTRAKTLPTRMPYRAGRDTPVTAQHFLTYRWDKTSVADGTYWIRRVPYPVLILRDQSDGAVLPFESYMLLDAAHGEGSLVKSIDYILLPDKNPPSEQGHIFAGNEQPLADALVEWLQKHGL